MECDVEPESLPELELSPGSEPAAAPAQKKKRAKRAKMRVKRAPRAPAPAPALQATQAQQRQLACVCIRAGQVQNELPGTFSRAPHRCAARCLQQLRGALYFIEAPGGMGVVDIHYCAGSWCTSHPSAPARLRIDVCNIFFCPVTGGVHICGAACRAPVTSCPRQDQSAALLPAACASARRGRGRGRGRRTLIVTRGDKIAQQLQLSPRECLLDFPSRVIALLHLLFYSDARAKFEAHKLAQVKKKAMSQLRTGMNAAARSGCINLWTLAETWMHTMAREKVGVSAALAVPLPLRRAILWRLMHQVCWLHDLLMRNAKSLEVRFSNVLICALLYMMSSGVRPFLEVLLPKNIWLLHMLPNASTLQKLGAIPCSSFVPTKQLVKTLLKVLLENGMPPWAWIAPAPSHWFFI